MTTIALVGAGAGLGTAIAHRFGKEGFSLALISRTLDHVQTIAGHLHAEGFTAHAYAADVRDRAALTSALGQAAADLGPIEVLTYSPVPQRDFLKPLLDTTVDDLAAAMEFSVYGPATAIRQVLPGMRELGRGTILFVNGGSGARPNAKVAGTSTAFAAEGAYARMLHDTLAPTGIRVRQLIVPGGITPGHPTHDPAVLADRLWALHTEPGDFRVFAEPMDLGYRRPIRRRSRPKGGLP